MAKLLPRDQACRPDVWVMPPGSDRSSMQLECAIKSSTRPALKNCVLQGFIAASFRPARKSTTLSRGRMHSSRNVAALPSAQPSLLRAFRPPPLSVRLFISSTAVVSTDEHVQLQQYPHTHRATRHRRWTTYSIYTTAPTHTAVSSCYSMPSVVEFQAPLEESFPAQNGAALEAEG